MSSQDQDGEKSFDATPQKLIEARKKGEVAKSTDLFTASAYAGLLVALLLAGQDGINKAGTSLMVILDQSSELAPIFLNSGTSPLMGELVFKVATSILPLFALPAAAVILSIFAQRAFVFAPNKLSPKISRLSPISNAKNKFGRNGLFEFFKSFVKLCIYSACLTYYIKAKLPEIFVAMQGTAHTAVTLMAHLCIGFLGIVVLISVSIGGIDAIWQHFEHLRKNMMSRKEIADETKGSEGDPHLKNERRQRAMSITQNQMMAKVPTADVIIVNPTHYAVALLWDRKPGSAPVCVAKGVDEIALTIKEVGLKSGVPIHSDPPTARSLFAATKIGEQIDQDQFHAVAAAIRFAQEMRRRAKDRG